MSLHSNDKKSFKLFKKIKTPSSSPFISRKDKDKSSDKSSLKSSDNEIGLTKSLSTESEGAEKTPEKKRSAKSPKFKSSSLRKVFKKPSSKRSKSTPSASEASETEGQVSFSNIICSTPLINPEPNPSRTPYITAPIDSGPDCSPYQQRAGTKPPSISLDTEHGPLEKRKDQTDRSDESGIFSPSFLEERFTPPPDEPFSPLLEEPFSPPTHFNADDTEYTPPSAFKSKPQLNETLGSDETFPTDGKSLKRDSSCESDKMFSRLKIPAIELTKPNKAGPGYRNSLSPEPNYLSADSRSVDSLKDVSTLDKFFSLFFVCYF